MIGMVIKVLLVKTDNFHFEKALKETTILEIKNPTL